MKHLIFVGLVLFTVTGCSQKKNTNTFFVDFEKAEHLTPASPVVCNGINVGSISSLKLNCNSHIIAEIEIYKSVHVREGYQFAIVWFDSFGKRAIELIPSDVGKYLVSLDSVKGITIDKKPIQQLDSLEYQIARDSIFKVKKQ